MNKFLLSCMAFAAGTAMVAAQEAEPVFPESFGVTVSFESAEVTQGEDEDYGMYFININGECPDESFTVTLAVPEGWDGFIGCTDADMNQEVSPMKKVNEAEWVPTDALLAEGSPFKKTNTLTFNADGEHQGQLYLYKGEQADEANRVLIVTNVEMAAAVEYPEAGAYPEKLNYTINGEAELEGVKVEQEMSQGSLSIKIAGETDAETVAITFETPEGWDGLLIAPVYGDVSEVAPLKTRSEDDWYPISFAAEMQLQKGNTVTFPVDGEWNGANIGLYKGEFIYSTFIDLTFDVQPKAGDDPVVEGPAYPESFVVDAIPDEGVVVTQAPEWGVYTIKVNGEVESDEVTVVIDIPEGWTGLVSNSEFVKETGNVGPKTRADEFEWEEPRWITIESAETQGYKIGNRFSVPADGEQHDAAFYLYKDGMVDLANEMALEVKVTKKAIEYPTAEFPEKFDVKVSFEGAEVTQGLEQDVYTVKVSGECSEESYTVSLEVPEGWDGYIGMSNVDYNPGIAPMKKANTAEWAPVDMMLEQGLKKTNSLTFPNDGEEYMGQFYLYKGDFVDAANQIVIETYVKQGEITGPTLPEFPEEIKVSCNAGATVWQGALAEVTEKTSVELTETELKVLNGTWHAENALVFTGKIAEDDLVITFDLPEGWSGVQAIKVKPTAFEEDGGEDEVTRTRANDSEWEMLEDYIWRFPTYMFEVMTPGTQLTVPVENEKQIFLSYLYLNDGGAMAGDPEYAIDLVDSNNAFVIIVAVENEGSGVNGVEAAEKAEYYNVNGVRVANPGKGLYIKVVDGKATKVTVK